MSNALQVYQKSPAWIYLGEIINEGDTRRKIKENPKWKGSSSGEHDCAKCYGNCPLDFYVSCVHMEVFGTTGKVTGTPKMLGFVLWGPWISKTNFNFKAIYFCVDHEKMLICWWSYRDNQRHQNSLSKFRGNWSVVVERSCSGPKYRLTEVQATFLFSQLVGKSLKWSYSLFKNSIKKWQNVSNTELT